MESDVQNPRKNSWKSNIVFVFVMGAYVTRLFYNISIFANKKLKSVMPLNGY